MVIIWLMMVNDNLVGGWPTPLKNMQVSWNVVFPIYGKMKMFQTTNQLMFTWSNQLHE